MILRYFYDSIQFEIEYSGNYLIFTRCSDDKRIRARVYSNPRVTWKIHNGRLYSNSGAAGLFSFFGNAIKNNFMLGYLNATIRYFFA